MLIIGYKNEFTIIEMTKIHYLECNLFIFMTLLIEMGVGAIPTITLSDHATSLKVGSHYERLFQRWPAFDKSNK